jgi:hypothetical protein
MSDGVENHLSNRALIEGRDVQDEKAILVMLGVVAEVDCVPDILMDREKSLPVVLAEGGGARSLPL